ncbi:MAG: 3-phosphoshikimate 1-carboxyvinyltransferase [Gammaproteobacteria bacterium]|nr:3-phosphoshikimate 1-carboxyvinyltransferase [Gammaproteobacteria bacterium]
MRLRVQPGGVLAGTLRVPGDKSISHRALMLAAVAHGDSRLTGLLEGEDVVATRRALVAAGADIRTQADGSVLVRGRGPAQLRSPAAAVDLGNSGTSIRLLTGLAAGIGLTVTFVGDASLMRRPMRRVIEPLARMGAQVQCSAAGTPPVHVHAAGPLCGIDYTLPVASAQVKSAILLAGLFARGATRVTEPLASRDHTERMLAHFGAGPTVDGLTVCVPGFARLRGGDLAVPGDISSAAFFLVGAAIAPGSRVRMPGVGVNPTRTGILELLAAMGARVHAGAARSLGSEPVADLEAESGPLHGIAVPEQAVPRSIDEFPALMIAAACAEGETRVSGAAELRVKESDRIAAMAEGLAVLGVETQPSADGIVVRGGPLRGGVVDSRGDHRVAMAFAMAALRASGPIEILGCENVATSFPGFAAAAAGLGLRIEALER